MLNIVLPESKTAAAASERAVSILIAGNGDIYFMDSKIDLTKSAVWNAKKQDAHPQWMAYRMRKLREKLKQSDADADDSGFWS